MSKIFNTLQARYDNATPYTPSQRDALHEDISNEVDEVLTLLEQLEQRINAVHKLAEGSEWEEQLDYLMYKLDTDTAKQECINFLSGE